MQNIHRRKSAWLVALLFAAFGLQACTGETGVPGASGEVGSEGSAGSPTVGTIFKPAPAGDAEKAQDGVTAAVVQQDVEVLAGVRLAPLAGGAKKIPERGTAEGRAIARQFIKERMQALGLQVQEHAFTSAAGKVGANVEGTLPGQLAGQPGERHLYVTAHMDSVSNAGAEDNASGVAGVLATAQALASLRPRDTIHFVAFDLEEIGLVGSFYYVRDQVKPVLAEGADKVIGNINMDMIGHDSGGRRLVYSACDAPALTQAMIEGAKEAAPDLNIQDEECDTDSSDQARFVDQDVPALYLADDFWYGEYPWYHEETDTSDRLMFDYLAQVAKNVTAGVVNLTF